jgi:hypothetical protein
MRQSVILLILLISVSGSLFAQGFTGLSSCTISSSGTQGNIQLHGDQLVTQLVLDQQKMVMMIKTPLFSVNATERGKSILNEVLLIESNQVFKLEAGISELDLDLQQAVQTGSVSVPITVPYNGSVYEGSGILTIEGDEKTMTLSFEATIDISQLGLSASGFSDVFSNYIVFSVEGVSLIRRY